MNYDTLATKESIGKTISSLKERGHLAEIVESRDKALLMIKELVPTGASIINGSSRTREEIGFVEYLKQGKHAWNNLHETVLAEKDPVKQAVLRKQALLSDYYLGSVHAISETGEIVVASNSGSQLPHLAFTSQNLILVVGTQKITPTLDTAISRLKEYVYPLENTRMKEVGMGGSYISKILVIEKEQPFMGRKSHVIFVNEKLGF